MYKDYISWIDLLLVPLYFIVLYAAMVRVKRRNRSNILVQKYFLKGFVFKIACALFYAMLIYFYYGGGDSINYYRNVLFVKDLIGEGSESLKIIFEDSHYLGEVYNLPTASTDGGWLVEKVALILSYFSFSRFLIVTMFFATIAYSGMFKMFETFASIMPQWHKRVALIVLFFPSIAVYGSGILKDTMCIASLGWLLYSSNMLFVKKQFRLKYIFILAFCFIIIYAVKIYIIAAFIVPYIIYLLMGLVRKIESRFFRRIILPVLLGILVIVYTIFAANIDAALGNYAIEQLFESVKVQQQSYLKAEDAEAGSVFDLGTIEPSLSGFIKKMPAGITATLYRPFLWESRKVLMLFSALEGLVILIFTLYVIWKAGILRFIKIIFNDPFIFLCISYALIFAAIVGLSTSNFGTLARYRIPIIPFYLTGILAVLYEVRKVNLKTPHGNIE